MNRSRTLVKRWLVLAARLAAMLIIAGVIIYRARFAPLSVVAERVEAGPIVAEVMGTGTLEARVATTISPKISARVAKLYFDQGDRVSSGDLLVQLDDDELRQQVAIAEANVAASAAAIERLNSDKERARAILTQAQESHARKQRLSESDAVSQDDLDRSIEALAIAVAGVSRAEAGIAEGQKERVAAEKTLEYQRARLDDTQITAPFDGMIVKRSREPGDVVVPGSEILTLISTDELWIRAWVDETEMAKLSADQTARVTFRSEPDRSYPGKVVRLGREADRETREFVVDVRVLELPKNWATGQRAETFIEVARKSETLTLPAKLLRIRDGKTGVYVSESGRARWRPIKQGLRSRDTVEVVDGVTRGERVIAAFGNDKKLRHGRRVIAE